MNISLNGFKEYCTNIELYIELTPHCEEIFDVRWYTRRIQSALLLWLCAQQTATLVFYQTLSSISSQTFPKAFLIPSFKFSNVALKRRNIKFILRIDQKEEIEGIKCGEPRDQKILSSLSYAHAVFYCRMKS